MYLHVVGGRGGCVYLHMVGGRGVCVYLHVVGVKEALCITVRTYICVYLCMWGYACLHVLGGRGCV